MSFQRFPKLLFLLCGLATPMWAESDLAGGKDLEAARKFWSYRSLSEAEVPEVKNDSWVRTEVDRFILARLEAAKVEPNEIASLQTLIRRVSFDLRGLPPTPEEVESFELEAKKDFREAYEKLVDRFLSDSAYGERWGRHWLDLARFAESNGYAFDKDRKNAFRYRDFVIRALNDDMPYDRFVRLQMAGDLLKPDDVDSIAATGFLVAGPFTTQQTQKERERSRYEQLDDVIHTIGTALLGQTIGCARCHEHKYDPVSQQDYYRLASIFSEMGFADVGLDEHPEVYKAAKAKYDKEHKPIAQRLSNYGKEELPGALASWLADRPEDLGLPSVGHWWHMGPFKTKTFDKAFVTRFAPEREKDIDVKKKLGVAKLAWQARPEWKDGKVHNVLKGENAAHYLYREIDSPYDRTVKLSLGSNDAFALFLNNKEVFKKKVRRAAAPDQEKLELHLVRGKNRLLLKIVNGGDACGFYFKPALTGPSMEVVSILKKPRDAWNDKELKKAIDWFKTIDQKWITLERAVKEHKSKAPKPDLTMIYAAKKRGSTYNFGANTYKVFFLNRGNPDQKGDVSSPGFLPVLMRPETNSTKWLQQPEKSRIALADWLTDVEHGAGSLLARVIVNRLWHHHFGRGIVATPSDFGTRGELPSHPLLLDYLARRLIDGGWKLKPIHKLIMTSAVYAQSGKATKSGQMHDRENLLLWRKPARRLEAEVMRDSLLAVSGVLDRKAFGPGSLNGKDSRRSVYLTVKRSKLIPLLQLFDAPDAMQSVGKREVSTVAPQSLALMNSPFVSELAGKLAVRARKDPKKTSFEKGLKNAYQIAYARLPDEFEIELWQDFASRKKELMKGDDGSVAAFRDVCHALICSNEFAYVD